MGAFSAISGQLTRSIVFGTFLPALAFVLLAVVILPPYFPPDWTVPPQLELLDPTWRLLVLSLVAAVLTGLLYNANIQLLRIFEGYTWSNTWLGRYRTEHYKQRYVAAEARWTGLRTLVRAMDPTDARRPAIRVYRNGPIADRVNREFPRRESFVLPTRLGNVIRSYEDYPYRQYGMEAITLWPRLVAKIDKEYAGAIEETKTSFDFMMNSSTLSALLSLIVLALGAVVSNGGGARETWLLSLGEALALLVLAYWFYGRSIERATAWGARVKGAFDLYRWDLLKQLGYHRLPTTMAEERDLWADICQQMIYGDTPTVPLASYAARTTSALPTVRSGSDDPDATNLEVTRGRTRPDGDGTSAVILHVKNVDLVDRKAVDVIVTDTIPEGSEYQWDSVRRIDRSGAVEVVGVSPIQFLIGGELEPGESAIVMYHVIERGK